ncbi:MAG: type II secretion system protein GspL [Pseudomonadota bacterium]
MATLFLRALSAATLVDEGYSFACEWLVLEADGTERASGVADYRGLGELVDGDSAWAGEPDNLVMIVSSEYVLGVSVSVPGRNAGQIRKALPFAVEEFVATDIEGMHLAAGSIVRGEPVRCNLVDLELLEGWIGCLASLGLTAGALLSEAELLPNETDVAYALLDGDQVLVKTTGQAATVDRLNLAFALQALEEPQLRIVNGDLTPDERRVLLDETSLVVEGEVAASDSTLGYLANRWREYSAETINLLQGAFTPRRPKTAGTGQWLAVAGLAAVWAVVFVLASTVQAYWSDREAGRLAAEGLAKYQELFPSDRRANERSWPRRLRQRLGDGAAQDGVSLLGYLNDLGAVLGGGVTLNGLNFDAARSELAIDLYSPDFNRLERIQGALREKGYGVEVLSAQQEEGNRVRARLRLQTGGAA